MFFTVFASGSKGGIFSTWEKTLISDGTISIPPGAFSEDWTLPVTLIEECGLRLDIFSITSSGDEPFFATICKSPNLSRRLRNEIFPCPRTLRIQPITVTSEPSFEASRSLE